MKKKYFYTNSKLSFPHKTDREMVEAYWLFYFISKTFWVKFGLGFLKILQFFHLPIRFLVQPTVYKQFCAGETLVKSQEVAKRLIQHRVFSLLAYSVEGEADEKSYDHNTYELLLQIDHSAKDDHFPFVVFKPTAFGSLSLFERVSLQQQLDDSQQQAWQRIIQRFDRCCQKSYHAQISILIDAEESWIQPAIDLIVEEMVMKYNEKTAVVFTTVQCYLHNRLQTLRPFLAQVKNKGYYVGIKLVRGAYMEKEAEYALKHHIDNPVCSSKEQTDQQFNEAILYCLENIDHIHMFLGTHNEFSSKYATEQMDRLQILKNDTRIWFSQLYGMSDNISFNLANKGYNVIKYIPYGPVNEVLPYLIRRANENSAITSQTQREVQMLRHEINRRKKTKA